MLLILIPCVSDCDGDGINEELASDLASLTGSNQQRWLELQPPVILIRIYNAVSDLHDVADVTC